MPNIRVKGKRAVQGGHPPLQAHCRKDWSLTELRAREFYEKPTAERKRKLAAAVKRHRHKAYPHDPAAETVLIGSSPRQREPPASSPAAFTLKEENVVEGPHHRRLKAAPKTGYGSAGRHPPAAGRRQAKGVDERVVPTMRPWSPSSNRLTKQRKRQPAQYQAANRPGLAAAEQFEITVLSAYLPEKMGAADLVAAVAAAIAETSANGNAPPTWAD